jgi:hypothetical protein
MTDESLPCSCSKEPAEALRHCGLRIRGNLTPAQARADAHFVIDRVETQVFDSGYRDRTYRAFIATSYL